MTKQQLLSLVQEIEYELGTLDLKYPHIIKGIGDKLTECKSKITEHHEDIIEEIDEFLNLLSEYDIDGVIEIDEMFSLIDQLYDILDQTKAQISLHHNISYNLLLETKGLLESITTQSE